MHRSLHLRRKTSSGLHSIHVIAHQQSKGSWPWEAFHPSTHCPEPCSKYTIIVGIPKTGETVTYLYDHSWYIHGWQTMPHLIRWSCIGILVTSTEPVLPRSDFHLNPQPANSLWASGVKRYSTKASAQRFVLARVEAGLLSRFLSTRATGVSTCRWQSQKWAEDSSTGLLYKQSALVSLPGSTIRYALPDLLKALAGQVALWPWLQRHGSNKALKARIC